MIVRLECLLGAIERFVGFLEAAEVAERVRALLPGRPHVPRRLRLQVRRQLLRNRQRCVGEDQAELRLALVHPVRDFRQQPDHGQRVEARIVFDTRGAEADRRIDQRHDQLAGAGVRGGDCAGLVEERGRHFAAERHRCGHFPRHGILEGRVEGFDDVEGAAAIAAGGYVLRDRFPVVDGVGA